LAFALGSADYLTGDLSLGVFYIVPIAFATWFLGRKAGFVISVTCVIEIFLTNSFVELSVAHTFSFTRMWNSMAEGLLLFLTAQFLFRFKVELDKNTLKARELAAANKELEAFNYSVAHDLRSPLGWIGGFSQILLKRYADLLEEKHRDYLVRIAEGTSNMEKLIDALLNFSKVGHCELRLEPVDLSDLARNIARELTLSAPQRRVTFRIPPSLPAEGDRQLLDVVVRNLMGNAWKYSAGRGETIIELGSMGEGGRRVFFVRDNGVGFSEQEAEALFIPFKRLKGADNVPGHGIGLATVQRIVQRHGGRIWAEGKAGEGAVFYFNLADYSERV
jgi:light-regulated signal transduction histidine kinase (bacteriophytochrome)